MKNVILLLAILTVSLCFAQGETQDPFKSYNQLPNQSNFLNAYNHLSQKTADDLIKSNLYLAYLCSTETNRYIDSLEVMSDSLNAGQKFQLANLLLSLGQYKRAIPLYEKLNASTPDWSCPWRHKGEAYLKLSDYQSAEKSLYKAIETNEKHFDAYVMLAQVQYLTKQYKAAYQTIKKAESLKNETENPEEAVSNEDFDMLYLKIIKMNNKKDYQNLKIKMLKLYPNNKELQNI